MKNRFVEWSKKKYTKKQRFIALIPEVIFFLVIIPLCFFVGPFYIDRWLNIPSLILGTLNLFTAIFLIIFGLLFSLWSIQVQFKIGKGTPAPMMPTQKLVITGPYLYCRNPMYFGAVILYLGIAVLTRSLSSFGIVILTISAILIYIKLIEEKELTARFGQNYLNYCKRTPFFIPWIRKDKKNKI